MKEIDYTSLNHRALLRAYAMEASPGPWYSGHLSNDSSTCNCPWITSQDYFGSICTIDVDNGLAIGEGGNDSPPLKQAKGNQLHIAANHPEQTIALLDYIIELEDKLERLGVPCHQKYGR